MAAPSMRQLISPAHTGTSGLGPTKPVHTSVPPETEPIETPGATARPIHSKPLAGSGAAGRYGGGQAPSSRRRLTSWPTW